MMYSEFVKGTGCKETENNYKVFQNLEAMYMNTDMTKEEIYEYGKKLVDNSKTAEEIELENKINFEIGLVEDRLNKVRESIKYYAERSATELEFFGRTEHYKALMNIIKQYKAERSELNSQLRILKEILKSA